MSVFSFRTLSTNQSVPRPSSLVKLTDQEDKICQLLDEFTRELKSTRPDLPHVQCRIAGGWVRDKLLGRDSSDIDIALSSMMGVPFAELLVPFMEAKGLPTKGVTKIGRNPEQSKHLETAKTAVLGLEVDFVNLRSEVYTEGSRIPSEIAVGTPEEDAFRRDITINSLFYNVHDRQVEDLTGKGLDDLRAGIVRTPLRPHETFMDDPLRVLRCLRFASRFGFTLDPDLEIALKDPEILSAMTSKISRERVGEELDKMMKGPNPLYALQLVDTHGLHSSIFWLPTAISSTLTTPPGPPSSSLGAASLLHILLDPESSPLPPLHPDVTHQALTQPSTRARLYLAAALTPYRGSSFRDKKRQVSAVEGVLREGLKFGTQNHYLDGIPALFSAADLLKGPPLERPSDRPLRLVLGLLLRDKHIHCDTTGSHWSISVLFSLIQELVPLWDAENDTLDVPAATDLINKYNEFSAKVVELNLPGALDEKPRLDGREVATALNIKPGPSTGKILNNIVEWQLEHPLGTKSECVEWLKAEFSSGRLQSDDGKRPTDGDSAPEAKPTKKRKSA